MNTRMGREEGNSLIAAEDLISYWGGGIGGKLRRVGNPFGVKTSKTKNRRRGLLPHCNSRKGGGGGGDRGTKVPTELRCANL